MQHLHIENLSAAIVRDALKKYRWLLRRCKTWKGYEADQSREKMELERFFTSAWCDFLTGGNGQYIMDRTKSEILR